MARKKYDAEVYVSNSNQGFSCPICGEPFGKMREVVFDDNDKPLKELRCSNCCNYLKLKW